jgi:hypothetical protein
MSANRGPAGDRSNREDGTELAHPRGPETPPRLVSTLVTYRDRADRRTVYPPGLSSVARMSTWFTADDDAFVELSAMR